MGELKWASVCPPSQAATSSMWTELKRAHPSFPWWGYFHWAQADRQRNWLSTCAWQSGRRLQLCCTRSQLVGTSPATSSRPATSQPYPPCWSLAWSGTAPPQPPHGGTIRNSKPGFFRYQLLLWHHCFPLCMPLSFTESLPAAQLLEWVEMTFGMFSLALKDSSALCFPLSHSRM